LRDRFNGRVVRAGDHPDKLRIELERLLEEQKALQRQRPIEADILGRCRAWLASLPAGAVLEQIIPDVNDVSLSDVRARIKKLQNQAEALKRLPKTILAGRSWWALLVASASAQEPGSRLRMRC